MVHDNLKKLGNTVMSLKWTLEEQGEERPQVRLNPFFYFKQTII